MTTASKKPESLFDAPAIMVVLTERDIQSYGGRSLVEVLDRTTSVFFMGTQENLQGALTMRGDATLGSNNHILVLVNGRPIQESTHGGMIYPFLRSFPLASVEQIEIIRGPGSVLYGPRSASAGRASRPRCRACGSGRCQEPASCGPAVI